MLKQISMIVILVLALSACGGSGSSLSSGSNSTNAMPVPSLMSTLEGGTLAAEIEVYNPDGELVYEGPLTIENGQVTSAQFTLTQGITYNFIVTFNYTDDSDNTLSIAYVRITQSLSGSTIEISYTEDDISYDLQDGVSNDLSPSFNIGSYVIPNLDSDGDGISNIRELITGTDPFDASDTPDLITTNLDDEESVSGTLTLVATYNGSATLTSLYLEDPSLPDVNNEASIYQTSFNTTSFADGLNEFTFVAIKDGGEQVRVTKTFQFDNYPNINFFGISAATSQGSPFTLVWDVDNADTVTIDNGIGSVDTAGQSVFTPSTEATQITFNITASKTDSFTTTQSLTVYLGSTEDGQDPTDGVNLVWNPISSATGYTVELFNTTDCSGTAIQTTTSTTASISVSDLSRRSLYSYKVYSGGVVVFGCQQISVGDDGLVGWWKFNEGEGTTSQDYSGQDHEAELDESQWSGSAVEGTALSFDGVDDVVQISSSDFFTNEDAFSFEFWVNVDAAATSNTGILSTSSGVESVSSNGARIQVGTTSEHAFKFGVGFVQDYGASENFDYTGEWKHIVLTHSAEGLWQFYINGYRVRRVTDDSVFTNDGLSLGRFHTGAAFSYFKGLIDELAVYNRVLTTAEIRNNCQLNDASDVCADDDTPTIIAPVNGDSLSPTRIFYAWEDGELDSSKTVSEYQYCIDVAPWGSSVILDDEGTCGAGTATSGTATRKYYVDDTIYSDSDGAGGDRFWFKVRVQYDDGSYSKYSNTIYYDDPDELRGWWKFDSISSGTTPNELSTRANAHQGDPGKRPDYATSTCNGEDLGYINGGTVCFDGSNDFMVFYTGPSDITADESYNFTNAFTIIARVKPSTDLSASTPIFSRWNEASIVNKRQYTLRTSADRSLGAVNTNSEGYSYTSTYEDDGWKFLIMTFNYSEHNYPQLYVNGVRDIEGYSEESGGNLTTYASVYGSHVSAIGYEIYDSVGSEHYYKGAIDEIIVMERAVGAEEALNQYCAFEAEIASSDSTYEMPDVCTE